MDSTDEKMFKKMQLIKEADAKEQAKKQQKEIAKKKLDPAYRDSLKSQSSDYAQGTNAGGVTSSSGKGKESGVSTSVASKPSWIVEDSTPSNTQQKKAPNKAMQLGKPKKQNELLKDLQKEHLFQKQGAAEDSKSVAHEQEQQQH
jgi:hypothetical protein